ncbi:MAG: zinc ribbon domain-containing protein [Anaerolineales bacterium]
MSLGSVLAIIGVVIFLTAYIAHPLILQARERDREIAGRHQDSRKRRIRSSLKRTCPQCGHALRPSDRFCAYCGESLTKDL